MSYDDNKNLGEHKLADKAEQAKDDLKQRSESLKDNVKDKTDQIKEEIKEAASGLSEKKTDIKDAFGIFVDSASDFGKQSKQTVACYGREISDKTKRATSGTRKFIKKHPKESVAIVLSAVGLIGAMLNRKKISTLSDRARSIDINKIKKASTNAFDTVSKEAGKIIK